MPITIVRTEPATAEEWDEVWRACGYSTYFHSREWADAWAGYTGGKMRPAAMSVAFSDGKSAILPLSCERKLKGIVRHYVSSPAGTSGGWISQDALELDHGRLLANVLIGQGGSLTWRMNPYDPLVQGLNIAADRRDETLALDLADGFDAVLKRWTKGHRSAVHKAEREGVSVRHAASPTDWRTYFDIYRGALQKWGRGATSSYGWKLFEQLAAMGSENIRLWLAIHNERIVAGALCFYAPEHAVYWHGASLDSCLKLRCANLLMHAAIRDACERGLRWFDFNPSGGHEGVVAFKRSFGAAALSSDLVLRTTVIERVWAPFGRLLGIARG